MDAACHVFLYSGNTAPWENVVGTYAGETLLGVNLTSNQVRMHLVLPRFSARRWCVLVSLKSMDHKCKNTSCVKSKNDRNHRSRGAMHPPVGPATFRWGRQSVSRSRVWVRRRNSRAWSEGVVRLCRSRQLLLGGGSAARGRQSSTLAGSGGRAGAPARGSARARWGVGTVRLQWWRGDGDRQRSRARPSPSSLRALVDGEGSRH